MKKAIRITCRLISCIYNEDKYCSAELIELNDMGICLSSYIPSDKILRRKRRLLIRKPIVLSDDFD